MAIACSMWMHCFCHSFSLVVCCDSHANRTSLVQLLYKNFQDFHRLLSWTAFKSRIQKNSTKLTTSSSESSRPCILLFSLTACWCFFPLMWLKRYTSDEICNDSDLMVIFFFANFIMHKQQYFTCNTKYASLSGVCSEIQAQYFIPQPNLHKYLSCRTEQ